MKKNILILLCSILILTLTTGCNIFKSFDKPTEEEDAKFKAKESLKKAYQNKNYDAAIKSLEETQKKLTPGTKEYNEVTQSLAEAYMGKAGVNAFDIGITLTENTNSTSSALIKTISNIDFDSLEKASNYYDELIANSNENNIKTETYMSATVSKTLVAANDLTKVMYGEDAKVSYNQETGNYEIVGTNGSSLSFSDPETIKENWTAKTEDGKTVGAQVVENIEKSIEYLEKSLDKSTQENQAILKELKEVKEDLIKYKNVENPDSLDDNFINTLQKFKL